ncbi:MAG: TIGR04222 domain-containing membrane protein [Leptospiraceae bacterium]|nr:TIGR04222 domain-containing membrane protein [Leptospiraceae bacterium]
MIDWIREIPGPLFLLVYPASATLFCFGIRYAYSLMDDSLKYPISPVIKTDPFVLALLQRGIKFGGLLRIAVFQLTYKKYLKVDGVGKDAFVKTGEIEKITEVLHPIEEFVFNFIRSSEKKVLIQELNSIPEIKDKILKWMESNQQKLVSDRILQSFENRLKMTMAMIFTLVVISGLGITKLVLGLSHDKPVLFLFFLLPVVIGGSIFSVRPLYVTKSGKMLLKELTKEYQWLKTSLQNNEQTGGINPGLAVAIFGVSFLAGCTAYSFFTEAYNIRSNSSSGGCGSSGCSSSSCGGGSCGGGGCGGCGGGGD